MSRTHKNSIILEKLLERGKELWNKPAKQEIFATNPDANDLVTDLERYPHAFLFACIMDRQMPSTRVWEIPFKLKQLLGDFEFSTLLALSEKEIVDLFEEHNLHRFPKIMGKNIYRAIRLIHEKYDDNASNIWNDTPSSHELVSRLLEFDGVGQKIASMTTTILARNFKISLSDYSAIDVSVDVHVKRVLERLGIVEKGLSEDAIRYKVRALFPENPGLIDLPLWDIGYRYCKPKKPLCSECYMENSCPKKI